MKKIIFLIVIVLSVLSIYFFSFNKNIYYLDIGDYISLGINNRNVITGGYSKYVSDFISNKRRLKKYDNTFVVSDYRTTDLINDIRDNKKIDNNIQYSLIKADLITISIGNNDLIYELQTTNNLDSIVSDLDILFKSIREYSKETIVVNGFYYPFDVKVEEIDLKIRYMNEKLKMLCEKYNLIYNDIYKYIDGYYPSDYAYTKIGENIVKKTFLNNI